MGGKFQWKKFEDINIEDPFFDSLKNDYEEFTEWFERKAEQNEETLVYQDELGIGAFLYLKDEQEEIELTDRKLPKCKRLKIGTLRLATRIRGVRLGEGAVGVALWRWQEKQYPEIYATVFETHGDIINLFNRFGFINVGKNKRGEQIFLKTRMKLDYTDPYKSFPFIKSGFRGAGILPVEDTFHDRLFPYSELYRNEREIEEDTAGNGITKIYIATPYKTVHYFVGEPIGIYRKFTGSTGATYKSVVTSFCTITKVIKAKEQNRQYVSINEYISLAGNKTVYSEKELRDIYSSKANVIIIEMVYNGFFGKGNNVNHKTLSSSDLFPCHPYQIDYTENEFDRILEMGKINVQNVIIN